MEECYQDSFVPAADSSSINSVHYSRVHYFKEGYNG